MLFPGQVAGLLIDKELKAFSQVLPGAQVFLGFLGIGF